jgi:hypothetical protein
MVRRLLETVVEGHGPVTTNVTDLFEASRTYSKFQGAYSAAETPRGGPLMIPDLSPPHASTRPPHTSCASRSPASRPTRDRTPGANARSTEPHGAGLCVLRRAVGAAVDTTSDGRRGGSTTKRAVRERDREVRREETLDTATFTLGLALGVRPSALR